MPVRFTLICQSVIHVYFRSIYSYMPALYTLEYQSSLPVHVSPIYINSRSYILVYACHLCLCMSVLHTLICRSSILLYDVPIYSYMLVLFGLLYAAPIYSCMPVRYTLICWSHIFLYAGPIYSYIPVCYTLKCRTDIMFKPVLFVLF